ncbi:MAG: hypothetical protein LBQ15_05810, partial [Clostridium sp.]|nr:hypothetical protein [Clostridium sp.]
SKQEVLALAIDEEAIKRLTMAYDEGCRNLNDGFEPSFHKVFSSIVETEESRSWRNVADPYSDIP